MVEIPWQIVVAAILAPAAVMISLVYFLRDMVQARDTKERDMDRQSSTQFLNGSKATIQILHALEERNEVRNGGSDAASNGNG